MKRVNLYKTHSDFTWDIYIYIYIYIYVCIEKDSIIYLNPTEFILKQYV